MVMVFQRELLSLNWISRPIYTTTATIWHHLPFHMQATKLNIGPKKSPYRTIFVVPCCVMLHVDTDGVVFQGLMPWVIWGTLLGNLHMISE